MNNLEPLSTEETLQYLSSKFDCSESDAYDCLINIAHIVKAAQSDYMLAKEWANFT